MGLIPIGDSDFFFLVPCSWHVDAFTTHIAFVYNQFWEIDNINHARGKHHLHHFKSFLITCCSCCLANASTVPKVVYNMIRPGLYFPHIFQVSNLESKIHMLTTVFVYVYSTCPKWNNFQCCTNAITW